MALTGKTIGQLTYLQFPTNDTLLPVEYLGDTNHITFSSITYTEGTYSQLVSDAGNGVLTPGKLYLMTDYQTCYDQPLYDSIGTPITTGNYKTGSTEPLLLLAISTSGFSPTVISSLYPKDKITYDINWNMTEVTSSPAKGRITERIDDSNNRTDYDSRSVDFVRYSGFYSEEYYNGTVNVSALDGKVDGFNTTFLSSFIVGDVFGVFDPSITNIGSMIYYEVINIVSDTEMYVTGKVIFDSFSRNYSKGILLIEYTHPFQCNLTGSTYTGFSEYKTFDVELCSGNYIGNNDNYNTFILSNNLFLGPFTYRDNYFGSNCVNNSFRDDIDSTTAGANFQYNIIDNDFDSNVIGTDFKYNMIICDFDGNLIGEGFQYNMIGDFDGLDFDYNRIGFGFRWNFLTMYGSFLNNNIGQNFSYNIINAEFDDNVIVGTFTDNLISCNLVINNYFNWGFVVNNIKSNFNNNKLGSNISYNNFYSTILGNTFGDDVTNNSFGTSGLVGLYNFQNNKFGTTVSNNTFSGTTFENIIGDFCENNSVGDNFSYNRIGSNFQFNTIGNNFGYDGGPFIQGNVIGSGFAQNTVSNNFINNVLGDSCTYNNIISSGFTNNKISFNFNNTIIDNQDSTQPFQNNTFTYESFNGNLTLSGGIGGNPVFYSNTTTNVVIDNDGTGGYVTFLSGGTFTVGNILL